MGWIFDLLKDIPLTPILKERLALAEDRVKNLEEENKKLKDENKILSNTNKELQEKIKSQDVTASFVEDSGVLFKLKSDGNSEQYAYCPICKQAMSEFPPRSGEMLVCARCTFTAPFSPRELNSVRSKALHNYHNRTKEK